MIAFRCAIGTRPTYKSAVMLTRLCPRLRSSATKARCRFSASSTHGSSGSVRVSCSTVPRKPFDDVSGILIRRKYGVEDLLDAPVDSDHGQPRDQGHGIDFEGGELQCLPEGELRIAQKLERQGGSPR